MHTPRVSWETLTLKLVNQFRVSYGASDTRQAHWLRLAGDSGWGEGTIPPYYGISTESMVAFWEAAAGRRDPLPEEPAAIESWVGKTGPAPARAALDLALHDRLGRLQNQPLHALLDLPRPEPKPTAFTIGIDTPEMMASLAAKAAAYPILKIKCGSEDDLLRVAAVRAARPEAELCVDANGGWRPEEAVRLIEAMLPYGITFIEQPVAKQDIEGLGFVQAHCELPVVADEALQTAADLERLAAVGIQGVNIKLMKVGGLTPGLALIRRALALGMEVMLGCMVETSLGVTAMAHLAGLARWLDLDAPLLIANDPFEGLIYDEQARIVLPERPGIGVIQRPAAPDRQPAQGV